MTTIVFESHGTTLDNEAGLSSGRFDVALSDLGKRQAKELGERYRDHVPDMVYCSDLRRSYETAGIAFPSDMSVIKDARLTECDYGDMTHRPETEVKAARIGHISIPFPNGESYEQCAARMRDVLADIAQHHKGKTVMIIGHRATQYGLEHWIKGTPLKVAVIAPWHWQPGWIYRFFGGRHTARAGE